MASYVFVLFFCVIFLAFLYLQVCVCAYGRIDIFSHVYFFKIFSSMVKKYVVDTGLQNTSDINNTYVDFLHGNSSSYEGANPQKRSPPWQSRTPDLAAWLLYQQPPVPSSRWVGRCGIRMIFFKYINRLKKIINLIKASILYYSLPPPNSTAPRTIEYCSPERSRLNTVPPVYPASPSPCTIPPQLRPR
jgi:hypothetical protein